jgi:o-succinylbenzoate synthase
VRTADDPLRIAGLDAADVIVVKVQPLGGVHRALEVVAAAGLPAVVSSALETSVGLAAGVALAAALPQLPYDCGLGHRDAAGRGRDRPPAHPARRAPRRPPGRSRRGQPRPARAAPEDGLELLERLRLAAEHLQARR